MPRSELIAVFACCGYVVNRFESIEDDRTYIFGTVGLGVVYTMLQNQILRK
jgi:hypothetical protein